MALVLSGDGMGWHDGEKKMHHLMHTPSGTENVSSLFLTPRAAYFLPKAPLLAVGTIDNQGRPWTTIWGGEPGFAKPVNSFAVAVKTLVDQRYDPVVESLLELSRVDEPETGRSMSGLVMDLASRQRVKIAGRVVGARGQDDPDSTGSLPDVGELQIVVKIESSLGNCPKYMNKKSIIACLPEPVLASATLPLSPAALSLIAKADLFFISSSHKGVRMSTNHRGGSAGFVRIICNDSSAVTLIYPEYSGNRLYQTLGNLMTTPEAGIVIPDFDTGDVLYLSGTTEIVFGPEAAALLPRSNLAVKFKVEALRLVQRGLPFRGQSTEPSPYNPPIRYLPSEHAVPTTLATPVNATLLKRDLLTPTIARFRFAISDPGVSGTWQPGQYVALSFEEELSLGYSHMRDDDPKSINDDFTRTFTISSTPLANTSDEFEITIRNVGVVTNFLFRQNPRASLEIPLKGFGGDFIIEQTADEMVPFVAGGIGITPLLGQLATLDIKRLRLFWSVNVVDVGLVEDIMKRTPALAAVTTMFVSGASKSIDQARNALENLESSGVTIVQRRLTGPDLLEEMASSRKWYLCAGPALKAELLMWLAGREIVYENFDY